MNREDIIAMAREAGDDWEHTLPEDKAFLERFAQAAYAAGAQAERQKVVNWMRERSYATGHGDSVEDLLKELEWQAKERGQENKMPITDDHGKAIKPQYQVVKTSGNWRLCYDQMQVGEAVRHEFRIRKMTHDIALYPGITLEEAIKRFDERVEADHE